MLYQIIEATTVDDLVDAVQADIELGWVSVGGVSASTIESQGVVLQAMTKE